MKRLFVIAALLASPALADCQADLQACMKIEDSLKRLACFEGLAEGDGESAGCPIDIDIKFKEDLGATMLNGIACPDFPFLTYGSMSAKWGGTTITVKVHVKNRASSDLDVIVEAHFYRSDGSEFVGGQEAKNADEGAAQMRSFKFKFGQIKPAGVRLKIYTAPD